METGIKIHVYRYWGSIFQYVGKLSCRQRKNAIRAYEYFMGFSPERLRIGNIQYGSVAIFSAQQPFRRYR